MAEFLPLLRRKINSGFLWWEMRDLFELPLDMAASIQDKDTDEIFVSLHHSTVFLLDGDDVFRLGGATQHRSHHGR